MQCLEAPLEAGALEIEVGDAAYRCVVAVSSEVTRLVAFPALKAPDLNECYEYMARPASDASPAEKSQWRTLQVISLRSMLDREIPTPSVGRNS
jgi:hypothetical protein